MTSREQAIQELNDLAEAEGITLPWSPEFIVAQEELGNVVDLNTGAIIIGEGDTPYRYEWTDAAGNLLSAILLVITLACLLALPAPAGAQDLCASEPTPGHPLAFVYADANNNGTFDCGEQPIANWPITLIALDADHVTGQVAELTNAQGTYDFGALSPGSYGLDHGPGNYGIVAVTITANDPGQHIAIAISDQAMPTAPSSIVGAEHTAPATETTGLPELCRSSIGQSFTVGQWGHLAGLGLATVGITGTTDLQWQLADRTTTPPTDLYGNVESNVTFTTTIPISGTRPPPLLAPGHEYWLLLCAIGLADSPTNPGWESATPGTYPGGVAGRGSFFQPTGWQTQPATDYRFRLLIEPTQQTYLPFIAQ